MSHGNQHQRIILIKSTNNDFWGDVAVYALNLHQYKPFNYG